MCLLFKFLITFKRCSQIHGLLQKLVFGLVNYKYEFITLICEKRLSILYALTWRCITHRMFTCDLKGEKHFCFVFKYPTCFWKYYTLVFDLRLILVGSNQLENVSVFAVCLLDCIVYPSLTKEHTIFQVLYFPLCILVTQTMNIFQRYR